MTPGKFTMNVLNGLAIGAVTALIPGALLGELCLALLPVAPWLQVVIDATAMASSMMGIIVGFLVALNFNFSPIQAASMGLAVQFAAAGARVQDGALTLQGPGDVITMGLTAAFGAGVVLLIGNKTRAYTIIVIPVAVLVVAGVAGRALLPYSLALTALIGAGISDLLTLQPFIMAPLIAVVFSILVVSPITAVGIALAISLDSLGSGAANVGVCAAGFGFAIAGWSVNTVGTSVAHFVAAAKISMANAVRKPKIMIPIVCSAVVCGLTAAALEITGTPMSAAFGISGLIGPLAYLGGQGWNAQNLIFAVVAFIGVPVAGGFFFNWLFTRRVPLVTAEDYHLVVD